MLKIVQTFRDRLFAFQSGSMHYHSGRSGECQWGEWWWVWVVWLNLKVKRMSYRFIAVFDMNYYDKHVSLVKT